MRCISEANTIQQNGPSETKATIKSNNLTEHARDVLRVLPPEHIFEDAEIIGIRFPEFDEATARVHQSPRAI